MPASVCPTEGTSVGRRQFRPDFPLLIGIVKNAIMMIDFALKAERGKGKDSADAMYEAAVVRFRAILGTTTATMLEGLPLAISGYTWIGCACAGVDRVEVRMQPLPSTRAPDRLN